MAGRSSSTFLAATQHNTRRSAEARASRPILALGEIVGRATAL
ncbi:hypothetical protein [Singulisphaera sp. PoT]